MDQTIFVASVPPRQPQPSKRTQPTRSGSSKKLPLAIRVSTKPTSPEKKPRKALKRNVKAKPRPAERSKSAKGITTHRQTAIHRKAAAARQDRDNQAKSARAGAEKNAAARLAFNAARQRRLESAKAGSAPANHQSFEDLRRAWFAALAYLSKFAATDSSAPDVLAAHRRLEEVEDEWERRARLKPGDPEYFDWPSTTALKGTGDFGNTDWEEVGMLGYLGYHVGRTSDLTALQRTLLLSRILDMKLPPLNSVEYMKQWNLPQSSARLKKMAETIASFTRNAKRRRHDRLAMAIREWEDDLSCLREKFYVGRFSFGWPKV